MELIISRLYLVLQIVGIILAITSGLLIGSSFVFKKKGLLRSQAGGELGEGVAYLKSPLWWLGMSMMILGEICNFAAYAFVEAIVVTPLGALSVVICAILSSIFLNEKLSFFGWLGCALCILGSVIIALNGPKEETVGQIREFQKLFLAPGFLAFISVLIVTSLVIIFYFAPKYGKKSMLWYIAVCSMIGGISVSVTTGLGAAIVQTALGDNQFKFWFMYFLFGFVIITLLVEVYYLNVALALFNTAMVTPTYYVVFTFFSMLTTIVLFQGLDAKPTQIITLVMGFLVICLGITILQMSKVDPEKLSSKLDRRSTMLLRAASQHTDGMDEKDGMSAYEDPGMDALRGSFGTVGSIIRARTVKRMSQRMSHQSGGGGHLRMRPPGAAAPYDATASWMSSAGLGGPGDSFSRRHQHGESVSGVGGMQRHQLYDAPVPRDDTSSIRAGSVYSQTQSQMMNKKPTIKFDSQEIVHSYSRPGQPQSPATHEHRQAIHGSMIVHDGYPPLPPMPRQSSAESSSRESEVPQEGSSANEGVLLEMDSPEIPKGTAGMKLPLLGGDRDLEKQTLTMPPLLRTEHAVHSAPPTMYRVVPRPGGVGMAHQQLQQYPLPQRKDSRDIFDQEGASTAGTRGTLLSFPSVTDSAPSEWDDDRSRSGGERGEASRSGGLAARAKEDKARERSKEKGSRTPKKYPKGLDDDDLEESERLWQKASSLENSLEGSEEGATSPPLEGSIRLVQPRKNMI
ncbi:hypothetical protein CVT25_000175 [Psilocybe cyanescens]|uniref:Magnesium transporter n=1 Tax=Psilocybe cyanescens TaxID=93625 RepID=A0A409XQH9_PSICY|nr:hypothetical protein CVT25_000175 [Psilocybe cyanescens]